MPNDPLMQRAACQGDPDCISKPQPLQTKPTEQLAQSEIAEFQARRLMRIYAVSLATAATIARLAYQVAR